LKAFNKISTSNILLYYVYALFSLLSILSGFYWDQKVLIFAPFIAFVAIWSIVNFKSLYFLMLALIPLSIEFDIGTTLATDLPTEPFMIGFLLVTIFYLLHNAQKIDFTFFKHPVMILLLFHLFWIIIATIFSTVPLFSFKFVLAKFWYVSSFLLITSIVIQTLDDVKTAFWSIYISLTFTVIYALFRHALVGFDFDLINPVLRPFYRNHVNYAAILAVFLPFVFTARTWYKKYSFTYNLLILSTIIYLAAIYFSYTRACYLAVMAIIAAYFVFKFKWTKYAIIASFILAFLIAGIVVNENHYLTYTPTTNTVSQHEFGDLVDATFKAEDVSSMERIYRWVAAIHMINDKPLVGFGPNGFVSNYKNYTVFLFETWISDNEERSGVHNYFLMTAVEQGLIGLVIFLSLIITIFIYGEKVYFQLKGQNKGLVLAVLLSMIALLVNLLFSDMIEVDKTGSFFFFNIALLVLLSRNFKGIILKH